MDKLKMHSLDQVNANIERIAELFPACVTESRDGNGDVIRAIDFDLLRQELSDRIVEGPQERYRLDWPGKREALLAANAPIAKTLRPVREESVDFDTTRNLFIEGDNLDALKLLQETYLGKVKMIYIDPPYNTGKDFVYDDDFAENTTDYLKRSNQQGEEGRLVANPETNGKFHSDWLTMILPRLYLARRLLCQTGVIFISVNDIELSNIRHLSNNVFGEENFLGTIVWKKKTNGNNMGHIPPVHDYIVAYAKSASDDCLRGFKLSDEFIKKAYSNPDKDARGPWTTSDLSANHKGPHFPIKNPYTSEVHWPPKGRYWVFGKEETERLIKDGRIIFGKNGQGKPVQKKFLNEKSSLRKKSESWWDSHGLNEDGTAELASLLGQKIFSHPKPSVTLKYLCDISSSNEDVVLDFFTGSGTTAHAVMQQNSEDGGKRRCISVQLPEPCEEDSEAFKAGYTTIAEIAKERIRRAGAKIKAGKGDTDKLDVGFRVLKIDTSNMAEVYYRPDELKQDDLLGQVDNVKPDRTAEDLLFQVLLDWGVDLSLPIVREKVAGREMFFVDGNALAACFVADGSVDEAFVKELAKRKPLRVVFRDQGFASDNARINVEQIFKTLSPDTDVRTL